MKPRRSLVAARMLARYGHSPGGAQFINGRELLAECLPSVLRAAEVSRHECRVAVIDNASTDDSVGWLSRMFPEVEIYERPE